MVCASRAFAQDSVLDRDRDPALDGTRRVIADLSYASLRYGSLYLLYRFELADVAVDPGLVPSREDDLKLSFGASMPNRVYWVPSRKFALSADMTPAYGFAERDGLQGQSGYAARGDMHLMLNRLYLNAYTTKADQFGPLPAELGGIGTAVNTATGVDAEVKYSSRTSVLMTGSRRSSSYPESRLQPGNVTPSLYDVEEDRARATFLHRTFPRIALSISAEGSNYELPRMEYRTAERRHMAAGATFTGGRKSTRVEAGPARLTFGRPPFRDFNGWIGHAYTDLPIGRRWRLTGRADRDLAFSDYVNNGYFVADEVATDLTYAATRRLSLHLRPTVGRHHYDTPVRGVLREDDYQSVLAGWTYSLSKVRGGFDVGYYQRDSNVFSENASGIRLILRLSFTGNRWFK